MRKIAGWSFIFFIGIVLVILGAQGKVGSGLATIVAPSAVSDNQASQ